jgi:pyruvate, orthophosphate dikinase
MPDRQVYYFGQSRTDGGKDDAGLLGGKGANIAEMTRIGIPVPPGFTITTEVCREYLGSGRYPASLSAEVQESLRLLEEETGKGFGSATNPLLLSVRSGAVHSMPGMMNTVLNLGLNDGTAAALAAAAGERFAYDSYRRFVHMYGDVVLHVPHDDFERLLTAKKEATGARNDAELDGQALRELVGEYKALVERVTGLPFPDDPHAQLWGGIEAVFRSWNTERAVAYRRLNRISDDLGTAVNIQSMVYGNMGAGCGTGVAFTRNPSTGERRFFGEFLLNAQGEDVVAGTRDPQPIEEMAELLPEPYRELLVLQERLERHYRDMQDVEFTVERGRLYMLQTRRGKRTAEAAVRIAVEMVEEGLITPSEAVQRIEPAQLEQLLHRRLDPNAQVEVLAVGLPASPGAASGRIVFEPEAAIRSAEAGEPAILVRTETSPEDFSGMVAARGILTSRGGMTSHAAVVARGMGKCCVVGARELLVDEEARTLTTNGRTLRAGDWLTLDGGTGRVIVGQVPTVEPEFSDRFRRLMEWADSYRSLRVRTNADTPADARKAREFGAEGIGLCRTEHMFFEGDRIHVVREMILARSEQERRAALAKLLPMQRSDFSGIFEAMDGLPVTIRLLDPPLHEFLPRTAEDAAGVAQNLGREVAEIMHLVEKHREANPMLGHRGVRLGISYPEITEMQARAIFEAAVAVAQRGVRVLPEIMIPLVGMVDELRLQAAIVREAAENVFAEAGLTVPYLVGTMIELPRAALTAGRIAQEADFFSFGTNDLTQTALGISRDDSGSFLPAYVEAGILADDPFQVLDREGVGRLIEIATKEGRASRPRLKVGICGEHGGEPSSVEFFHQTGLDYVSCSPFRVPVARLAAARAALKHGGAGQAGRLTAETVPPARQRRSSAEETLAQAIAVGESAG